MLLNSDFSQRVIITPDDYHWVPSPQQGVERVMLDRIGHEQARATSLVRYAPASLFPEHRHPGGEEILVLSGTFTENGVDYPAGWYLRSPDGSSHQPSSCDGTTIFVKLRQMSAEERQPVRIDTKDENNWYGQPQRKICPLFSGGSETALIQNLAPGERIFCAPLVGGAELLLLEGELRTPEGNYEKGCWLRFPPGEMPTLIATAAGALFYLKMGHLNPTTLTGVMS
ncbi:cupin domain-containing protein [Enterobacter cloacae complex sp. 2024EL-00214]